MEFDRLVRFTPCRFTLVDGGVVIGVADWLFWLEEAVNRSSREEPELIPGIGLSADGVPINIKKYILLMRYNFILYLK